jgi:DNA repair exonuclease SbcCD ATPase subunit
MTNFESTGNNTPEENQVFEAARAAGYALGRTFDHWMALARAVALAHTKAQRMNIHNAFQRILEQEHLAPFLGTGWKSQRVQANKLEKILEKLDEVEKWRAGLSPSQRAAWAAPNTVWQRCPVFHPPPPPKPTEEMRPHQPPLGPSLRDDASTNAALMKERDKALERVRELETRLASDGDAAAKAIAERNARIAQLEAQTQPADKPPPENEANTPPSALQAEIDRLKAEVARLKSENAALRKGLPLSAFAPPLPPELTPEMVAATRLRNAEERAANKAAKALAKAKAAAAGPETPDQIIARLQIELDKALDRIKPLTTRVQNLQAEMRLTVEQHREALIRAGAMSFKTISAISKCLHPDTRDQVSTADHDEALRLFTAWKADNSKAKRGKG